MNSLGEMSIEWKEDSKLVCIQTAINTFYYSPCSCGPAAPGDFWSPLAGWRTSTAKSDATVTGWETETEGIKATSPELLHAACWCLTARTAG